MPSVGSAADASSGALSAGQLGCNGLAQATLGTSDSLVFSWVLHSNPPDEIKSACEVVVDGVRDASISQSTASGSPTTRWIRRSPNGTNGPRATLMSSRERAGESEPLLLQLEESPRCSNAESAISKREQINAVSAYPGWSKCAVEDGLVASQSRVHPSVAIPLLSVSMTLVPSPESTDVNCSAGMCLRYRRLPSEGNAVQRWHGHVDSAGFHLLGQRAFRLANFINKACSVLGVDLKPLDFFAGAHVGFD